MCADCLENVVIDYNDDEDERKQYKTTCVSVFFYFFIITIIILFPFCEINENKGSLK